MAAEPVIRAPLRVLTENPALPAPVHAPVNDPVIRAVRPIPAVVPGPGQSPTPGPSPTVVKKPKVMATAQPARLRRRHLAVLVAFFAIVLLPVTLVAGYLYLIAADQYSSQMSFSLRSEQHVNPLEALSGLGQIATGSSSDSEIVHEYLSSQKIVEDINKDLDLRAIFGRDRGDRYFTLPDGASIEEMRDYWKRMISVRLEKGSGVLRIESLAFTPQEAQAINGAILRETQALTDRLSLIAREDALRYAEVDLEESRERLKAARGNLSTFRATTNIIDPTLDLASNGGVMGILQQQLVEALLAKDMLLSNNPPESDPRIGQSDSRIAAIRKRIDEERNSVSDGDTSSLVQIVGTFEALTVEREFAEKAFLSATAAYDIARAEAERRSRYVAVHIEPTLADSPLYPRRAMITGIFAAICLLGWALLVMIGYSLRDRG
ncbi:sugar transporter [Rhodobacter sp. 24-YEA-8]|uniref:sugar transporter n=1 Tax=Rhodobacter sp. 24-YEA-8 TaxID=1884310 RepID=UPI00089727D6|nr:sugar transporter [Rhodobacter sp. 24-YEA-8]SEC45002.1 capsular polysaccharide transport system permease protein [Rhodobacter sp. 24-YEA-8]